jgi:hypothetical protein
MRSSARSAINLAQVLAAAAKVTPSDADARAAAYDGAKLRAEAEKRDREQREQLAKYRAQLADGPVIELPMEKGRIGFDPNTIVSLGDLGNVYPTLSISADWGTLEATNGARMSPDFKFAYIGAADRDKVKLNPGWELAPGSRAGDLRVAPRAALP